MILGVIGESKAPAVGSWRRTRSPGRGKRDVDSHGFGGQEYLRSGEFAKGVSQKDKLAALRQCPFGTQRKISASKIF